MPTSTQSRVLRAAKLADRDAEKYRIKKRKGKPLTKSQLALEELRNARREAKLLKKRYALDHARYIFLRKEKRKLNADLRKQFQELRQEFLELNSLFKDSAKRLQGALLSTQPEKTKAYSEGFRDGRYAAEEESRQLLINSKDAREAKRTPDVSQQLFPKDMVTQ
jgi:hypothetical protein